MLLLEKFLDFDRRISKLFSMFWSWDGVVKSWDEKGVRCIQKLKSELQCIKHH